VHNAHLTHIRTTTTAAQLQIALCGGSSGYCTMQAPSLVDGKKAILAIDTSPPPAANRLAAAGRPQPRAATTTMQLGPMQVALVSSCSLVLVAAAPLHCDLTEGNYTCSRNGATAAVGAPIAVFMDGAWHSQDNGGLTQVSTAPLSGHEPVLGAYTGTEMRWVIGNSSSRTFVTCIRNFATAPGLRDGAVVFEYQLPNGAGNMTGNKQGLHTTFPAFTSLSPPSALSWSGDFVQAHGGVQTGIEGGPVVFSAPGVGAESLVVAPLSHYLSSSSATTAHDGRGVRWAGGLSSDIRSLPVGFNHSFILCAGGGVTDTLYAWGRLTMQLSSLGLMGPAGGDGSVRPKVYDQTLSHLSYQTDNGAQYCFCNKDCDAALLKMRGYLKELGVPIRLMSFQGGWWTNPNIHTPNCAPWCVTSWEPNKYVRGVCPSYLWPVFTEILPLILPRN
jgi:hypothetical protein